MTVSSASSETGTIRASSPPSHPSTRTPLVRATALSNPLPPLPATIHSTTTTTGTERKSKSTTTRPRIPPLMTSKSKPPSSFPDPLPANAVILHHRGKSILHIRPPTPIPLRPSTPVGLRGHARLPSTTVAGLLEASPLSLGHSRESSADTNTNTKTSTKPLSLSNKSSSKTVSHSRARSDDSAVMLKVKPPPPKGPLPPIPSSPSSTLSRRALSNHNLNGVVHSLTMRAPSAKPKRPPPIDIINFLDLAEDKENFTIPTIPDGSDMLPITPSSMAFPSSMAPSDAESDKGGKGTKSDKASQKSSTSTKSVRWAEVPLFPEQQSLVNIHGLLKSLLEDSKDEEINKACETIKRFLPQAGVPAERKYTLRTAQEEELEHCLRILDGALFRDLDKEAVEKARKSLLKLTPSIQQRFATLPYHREVVRLKAERSQLKEDRALVLVQLAIQEAEIKGAQARREAERNREIEEAALRRLKRREEKLRERKAYDQLRASLESRSKELKVVTDELEREVKKLSAAREDRDKRNLERAEKGLAKLKMGSVKIKGAIDWIGF